MGATMKISWKVEFMHELASEDPKGYQKRMRITIENFNFLLDKIQDKMQKADTLIRKAIVTYMKLQVTLDYLATGSRLRNLQKFYRISVSAISKFLPEVLDAIYESLSKYIKVPVEDGWIKIDCRFRNRWNFPDCYGALDGKQVEIRAPPHSGSDFFNYHETFSIILMAIIDHDYCFSYVNIGANGRSSDSGVFQDSLLFYSLENDMLPNKGCILADAAFPLKALDRKVFNYRLSRARSIGENGFGILVSRFRGFEKLIALRVHVAEKVVRTACALHNFLRKSSTNVYLPQGSCDYEDLDNDVIIEGSWRAEKLNLLRSINEEVYNASRQAKMARDKYKKIFDKCAVDWQIRTVS